MLATLISILIFVVLMTGIAVRKSRLFRKWRAERLSRRRRTGSEDIQMTPLLEAEEVSLSEDSEEELMTLTRDELTEETGGEERGVSDEWIAEETAESGGERMTRARQTH